MNLEGVKAHVRKEKFAIVVCGKIPADAFAVIKDEKEITAVVKEKELGKINPLKTEKGYSMVTFDEEFPPDTVGFLSKVSTALARNNISIMCYSSYSTDHLLVKDKDLGSAVTALKELGVVI